MATLDRQIEELRMIKYSLLPDELMIFIEDADAWNSLLDSDEPASEQLPALTECHLQVRLNTSSTSGQQSNSRDMWFELRFNSGYPEEPPLPRVDVKGDNLGREDQQRWQDLVRGLLNEVAESEYPAYELISTHLLPLLHDELDEATRTSGLDSQSTEQPTPNSQGPSLSSELYHALLTSHHLVSPTKRRSMAQWAPSLHLCGFAKLGYPGVIYVEGPREAVEEFVSDVRAMQWKALKLRFLEPVPPNSTSDRTLEPKLVWCELEKVGEVVQAMRERGRESYVVEMGVGSVGTK